MPACKEPDKRMNFFQQRYQDDNIRKIRNVQLRFTAGQYIYPDRPPMTTSAIECMATDLYNKLMPLINDGLM